MLVLLLLILTTVSIVLLCIKRNRESAYLFCMCASLLLEFIGISIFIAKKGGYSAEILKFLFFSLEIRTRVQYILITFGQLGYIIAIGRYLFPFFMLRLAMHYSMIPLVRKSAILRYGTYILPILSLIIYYPSIFRYLVKIEPQLQDIIVQSSYIWVLIYVGIAAALLVHEYFSITMKICKRQFQEISMCMIALAVMYILYCGQDPGQVYRFYSYGYRWNRGIGYLQYAPTISGYLLIVAVITVSSVLGFTSLFRYTHSNLLSNREDVVMERKFNTAKTGASVFVHSMKNQLLANRVLYKRIAAVYNQDEPDIQKLKEYTQFLENNNEMMLKRMEELYSSVKTNSICMVPVELEDIFQYSIERFHSKYPEVEVEVKMETKAIILADKSHFCEAVYNILINAWDAIIESGRQETGRIEMLAYSERLYTVIEIRDNGKGISKSQMKKIFDPFYSSKNSNHNWGMGLYYVRTIIKGHFGSLRVESKEEKGTNFYILLPKYKEEMME